MCDCSQCKDECTGSCISSRTVQCFKLNPCSVGASFSPDAALFRLLPPISQSCVGGSLVYNFKVGLSKGSWDAQRKECDGKIRSTVCVIFTAYYGKRNGPAHRLRHRPHLSTICLSPCSLLWSYIIA